MCLRSWNLSFGSRPDFFTAGSQTRLPKVRATNRPTVPCRKHELRRSGRVNQSSGMFLGATGRAGSRVLMCCSRVPTSGGLRRDLLIR